MTVSAGEKTLKNLKLENFLYHVSLKLTRYVYDLNTFHLLETEDVTQRVAERTSKKSSKNARNLSKS